MNTKPVRTLMRAVLLITTLFLAAKASAQPTGQWDFDSGNLSATVGAALTYADGVGGATEFGDSFGTTTSFGIPDINGTPAQVLQFPASTSGMGYNMPTPAANGRGIFVDNYTIIFDLLFAAESDHQLRPLLETDGDFIVAGVGVDLAIGPNNGVGVTGGLFDGVVATNTWYRIGFVVQTNLVRAYINGDPVGQQSTAGDRMVLTPSAATLILANTGLNPAANGYVNSIQLRDAALTAEQMKAIGGPSADGIPQIIPSIPSYVQSWTPSGAASRRTTDIGAIINPGDASVNLNSIVLKLNSVVQTGVQISSNINITVLKTGVGPLNPGTTYTLEVSYTDSEVGAKSFSKQFKPAFLFEDFEQLTLGTNIDEALYVQLDNQPPRIWSNVWTRTPPAGWALDNSGVPGFGNNDTDGVSEWAGWSFASKTFWSVETDDQGRQDFTYAQGTVAVADNDEWDDAAHPRTNYYSTWMQTGPIDITGIAAGSLFMKFDSSWQPEAMDDWSAELGATNNQTASIQVSFNGGPFTEVMHWDSVDTSPTFHGDNVNERVSLLLNNPSGATSMVIKFGSLYAANDWWWAIDNIEVNIGDIPSAITSYTPARGATGVGPRPFLGAEISPGTTTINPASVQLLLDGVSVAVTVTTNTQGRTVISGRAPVVLPKLSVHTNTLVYSDNLSGSQSTNWTFTVADYSEITLGTPVWMEEFNGVAEATFPAGWLATNRTSAINTNFDLGDPESAAFENFVVISTNRLGSVFSANRFNVAPATLNGVAVDALMSGSLVYGESDNRGGEQVQVLFSPAINLSGISNVKLAFNSIYTQNQDSMGAVEYSIDGGATWRPVLYMLKNLPNDDLVTDDPVATLGTARTDQAWDLAYGAFIGATVDSTFGPYISGRVDDDQVESKRIEVHSLPQAANQANVRLRFTHTGTGSWYFGIDDVAIYGDGGAPVAPIFVNQPQGGTVEANTPALLVAGIDPTSTRSLSFQWTRNGANVVGATLQSYAISSMQASDAGDYRLIVTNVAGARTSEVATLTYVLPVPPTITEDPTNTIVIEDLIANFAVTATGTAPLSYQWLFNGEALAGARNATLSLQHVALTNDGLYSVVVANNYGMTTSAVARLTVLAAPPVEVTGQWDFDCGNLQASAGNDLVAYDATVQADTQFGTTTSFGIADIGGSPASVLYFANSTGAWGGYRMYHGAAPNGGGTYVNRYTLVYDIFYPTASDGRWRCFLQTNTGNGNDGDIFVNTANGIGISGSYQGTVTANAWHRIVFVFDLPYSTLKKYIDGTLVGAQTLDSGLDGRWSLDPFALLFGDNDGDIAPAYANSIQFRNGIMTDAEVAALGGVTSAVGIPGAVPRIRSITRSGNDLVITWTCQGNVKLQKTTSLATPNWQDVAGSLGAGSVTDPMSGGEAYYRLVRQP